MSQLRLWVVIAAPSILGLIGTLLSQTGLHRVEDRLGARIDRVEQRMDKMMDIWNRNVKDLPGLISDHGQKIVRLEERR